MSKSRTVPDAYLEVTLRDVVALTGRPNPRGEACPVSVLLEAVEAFAQRLADRAEGKEAADPAWVEAEAALERLRRLAPGREP